jgi:hypothetical protein
MITADDFIEYSDVLLMSLGVLFIFTGGWFWGVILLALGFAIYWFID